MIAQSVSQPLLQPLAQCRPLIDVLSEIPDFRKARGKRHPLPAVLALVCVAVLCGYKSYSAISQWARIYPRELVLKLGLTHKTTPCPATLFTILSQLDRRLLESKLTEWAKGVLASLPKDQAEEEAVAIDGKTLRGSKRQGAINIHLLSALSHRLGLTLNQRAVSDKTNEITESLPLLESLIVKGQVYTMDALLTQRSVARSITEGEADYLMIAKGNQPSLKADIALVFDKPPQGDCQPSAETTDRAHGRIERRRLATSQSLEGYLDWPGIRQVFRLERQSQMISSGQTRTETVYGLTSLGPDRADPARLLELTRGHWLIENQSHWVRDVTFDEDRSQVRIGSTPQAMAAFRNTAIGLLRLSGQTNIASAIRYLAAQPQKALDLIGINNKTQPLTTK